MSIIFFSTFSIPSFAIFQYLLFFLTHSFLTKASCYFPDGTPTEDIPCTTNSSVGVDYCCGKGAICLANKICLTNTGVFARGTCTDKTWQSSICPRFCLSVRLGESHIVACSPLSSGTWCCEDGGEHGDKCCDDSSNLLTLGQVSIVTSKPLKSIATGSLSSSTTGDSSLSILNSASTAFASPSSTSTVVSSTNTVMSSGTTIFTSVPVSSSGLSDSVKVGIGLGVPLGAMIIAQLAYLLYRIMKQVNPKTHLQEGLTSCSHQQENLAELEPHCSHQQENLAELELHQDPHELSTERQRVP